MRKKYIEVILLNILYIKEIPIEAIFIIVLVQDTEEITVRESYLKYTFSLML